MLTRLARALHLVHPEISYRLGSLLFSIPLPPCRCEESWRIGGVEVCGPVGIAAGLDKSGNFARFLSAFCPGFIVVGSTLPRRRPGNRPPRMARMWPYSLVNAMGLNSPGLPVVVSRLSGLRYPVFISLAGFSPEDFAVQLEYLRRFYRPRAVEVNISSPTYGGLWRTAPLLETDMPAFLKVGPGGGFREAVLAAARLGWGLVISNTLPVEDRRLSAGRGGLSGLLAYRHSMRLLRLARELVGRDVPIIYSGGIFSCRQAREALGLADALEVLTAVLYLGPPVLRLLNRCVRS